MDILARKEGNVFIAQVRESRVDASMAGFFQYRMMEFVNEGNGRIVLDITAVEFIDSAGLGSIISVLKSLGSNEDLVICGTSKPVMGLFRVTRMDRAFRMFENVQQAVAALAG